MKVTLWEQLPPRIEPRYDRSLPGPSLLLAPPEQRKVSPYLLSATFHAFVALAFIVVTTPAPRLASTRETWKAKAMIIRLPQRVFMPTVDPSAAAAVRTGQPAGAVPRTSAGTKPFAPAPPSQITLIQPQYPLNLQPPPLSAAVPSAMVWNEPKPKVAPSRAVLPGPAHRDLPVVEMREPTGEVRASARILDVPDSVRVNAATLPVTQLAPQPVNEKRAVGGPEAHPVAVLSVSDARLTSDTIVVPPGNVISSASGGGSSAVGQDPATARRDVPAPTRDSIASRLATTPLEASRTGGREVVHPPNGRFDIVVIQSSPDESLPPGMLSGKPVYTVYLHVGDSKQWVMHFSATKSSPVQRGGVVQLPDPRPLTAPYPRMTVLPEEPVNGPGPYVLVHGVVDESGSLQNLEIVGAIQSSKSSLLQALSRWRFQPARRAESSERIEMVLAIPIRNTAPEL